MSAKFSDFFFTYIGNLEEYKQLGKGENRKSGLKSKDFFLMLTKEVRLKTQTQKQIKFQRYPNLITNKIQMAATKIVRKVKSKSKPDLM